MTVHQAKGMQWPVVFVPASAQPVPVQRRRRQASGTCCRGGRARTRIRYEGSVEDERRLFYVRHDPSQKFLLLTWAPTPATSSYRRPSAFVDELTDARKGLKRDAA